MLLLLPELVEEPDDGVAVVVVGVADVEVGVAVVEVGVAVVVVGVAVVVAGAVVVVVVDELVAELAAELASASDSTELVVVVVDVELVPPVRGTQSSVHGQQQ